jgi:hypothetical protein
MNSLIKTLCQVVPANFSWLPPVWRETKELAYKPYPKLKADFEVAPNNLLENRRDSKHQGSLPGGEASLSIFKKLLALACFVSGTQVSNKTSESMPGVLRKRAEYQVQVVPQQGFRPK